MNEILNEGENSGSESNEGMRNLSDSLSSGSDSGFYHARGTSWINISYLIFIIVMTHFTLIHEYTNYVFPGTKSKCRHCGNNKDVSSLDYKSDDKRQDKNRILKVGRISKEKDNINIRLNDSTDEKSLPSYYFPTTSSSSMSSTSNCSR